MEQQKLVRLAISGSLILWASTAGAARITSEVCERWPGEPNRAGVTVTVAPSAPTDTLNNARMTGQMFTGELDFQEIDVACAANAGNLVCTSNKTFGATRTVTNVEYAINGQQTLAGAGASTAFSITDQGVLCSD